MPNEPRVTLALDSPRVIAAFRLALATFASVALVARFVWGLGSATFEPANFFGYLTVQCNIAYVAIEVIAAIAALHGKNESARLANVRAIVLTCTVTSGIVFALIVSQSALRGIRVDVPWSDIVLHFVLPCLALMEWVFVPRSDVRWRVVVFVLGYPLVWGVLTIIRGAFVDWYPYYFLDPRQLESAGEFFALTSIALAVFLAVGSGLVFLPHRVTRRTARDSASPRRPGRRR
jgi:hypothetical protein